MLTLTIFSLVVLHMFGYLQHGSAIVWDAEPQERAQTLKMIGAQKNLWLLVSEWFLPFCGP